MNSLEGTVKPDAIRAEIPVYGGYVIARDGKVVFIKGAVPGELVEVSVVERKKDYSTAYVTNVLEPSPFRRQPPCSIFGICGGCHFQFIGYERQMSIKEEIILDTMRRIGGADISLEPSMTGNELGYRHRANFKVSSEGDIGFYRDGTRDVVPVEKCLLMNKEINDVLQVLRDVDLRGIKDIQVISGDTVVLLIKGDISERAIQDIMDRGISGIAFENGDSIGKDYITLDLNGIKYTVTPWSFFQSNWALNRVVVDAVIKRLSPLDDKKVLDLYAGSGNFSLPIALSAKEVVSVEENSYAVEDGRRNASLNGIKNCIFINASVEEISGGRKKQQIARFFGEAACNISILDPPRAGLTQDSLKKLMELQPEKIVYLSCNPATLARDIKKMKERYDIESLRMIDFFPNTYHIEALAFLNLKGS